MNGLRSARTDFRDSFQLKRLQKYAPHFRLARETRLDRLREPGRFAFEEAPDEQVVAADGDRRDRRAVRGRIFENASIARDGATSFRRFGCEVELRYQPRDPVDL